MQLTMASSAYATLSSPVLSLSRAFGKSFTLSNLVWDKFVLFARAAVCAALARGIVRGQIEITDAHGTQIFGQQELSKGTRSASIRVKDDAFWVRVYLWYDIGFSEAFMAGEFESPDLKEVLNIYIDNLSGLNGPLASTFYKLHSAAETLIIRFSHGFSMAVENVAGYEASNDLYCSFLSQEMMYSCPIWGDEEGGVRGDLDGHRRPGDLESAQDRKIQYVLRKARLRPGDRLLEIGSGWGGVAIAAAKMGCTVDTITLSVEQMNGARERVKEAGLENQVRVHLMDYRNLPSDWEKAFDACISIEMLEAVGIEWMSTYISKIDWALKNERAAVVLTATCYPESFYTPYQGNDFVRKYHWPKCVIPSATSLIVDFQKTSKGRFCVDSVEDFGVHYPRCLREWGRRLDENWTPELQASLEVKHPALKDPHNLAMFKRKWYYMYLYMEVAYSRKWLNLVTWTFSRPMDAAVSSA
ncbi:hypothetical protein QCA50_016342 [Cerrena zonata]|uniref:Cyclopropane-fatty-acyl-phospholipid synthase n=1 Tax=Cerrena zonata TaxID=2478898 RepID=A0AAW0FV08_9APHY